LLETMIIAASATEDDEESLAGGMSFPGNLPDGELGADDVGEPSLGGDDDDREAMVLMIGLIMAAATCRLAGRTKEPSEEESSLGWVDTGPQTCLAAGYSGGDTSESDENCDDEPDHESGGDINSQPQDEPQQDMEPAIVGRASSEMVDRDMTRIRRLVERVRP
jgi:hypothetical protein